jgi:hypothetical protein
MYPSSELAELERRKIVLRQRIAVTRLRCVALAGEAARPVHLLDRVIAQWRRISPFAKLAFIPLALLFGRRITRGRRSWFSRVLSFLPLALRGARVFRAHRAMTSAAV